MCIGRGEKLKGRIVDTMPIVRHAVQSGERVLLEGQLGVMRDLDWGIYPFVTSSNPAVGAACSGAGIPPTAIEDILGVVKSYSTAVGGGPFLCELEDSDGEKLREIGREYGATTGRPRRCGWFDGVAIAHAALLNGFTALAVTKMDILDHFEEIKVCTGYRIDGEIVTEMPDTPDLDRVEPITKAGLVGTVQLGKRGRGMTCLRTRGITFIALRSSQCADSIRECWACSG